MELGKPAHNVGWNTWSRRERFFVHLEGWMKGWEKLVNELSHDFLYWKLIVTIGVLVMFFLKLLGQFTIMDYITGKSSPVTRKKNEPQEWWVFCPSNWAAQAMLRDITSDWTDEISLAHNWWLLGHLGWMPLSLSAHDPASPRLSGQPSTQQVQIVTWDLSTNGVTPCHRFLGEEPVTKNMWAPILKNNLELSWL